MLTQSLCKSETESCMRGVNYAALMVWEDAMGLFRVFLKSWPQLLHLTTRTHFACNISWNTHLVVSMRWHFLPTGVASLWIHWVFSNNGASDNRTSVIMCNCCAILHRRCSWKREHADPKRTREQLKVNASLMLHVYITSLYCDI